MKEDVQAGDGKIAGEEFSPDFLQYPHEMVLNKELQPLDTIVYSVVFWFERLRNGRCFASNKTIAKYAGSSSSGVANSLARLRNEGYVQCFYNPETNFRTEIKCLIRYKKLDPYSNEEGGLTQMSNIIKNTKKDNMSVSLTDEQKEDVRKIYGEYLIGFKIDPKTWEYTTDAEGRKALLDEAAKRYKLTPKRKAKIVARLEDAGKEMCVRAIRACAQSSFHQGENETEWSADLEAFILRNYEKVEEWSNKYQEVRR